MARSFFTGEAHQPFDLHAGLVGALLIHGFMGSPKEMRPLAHALVDAGVSPRGVQLPGFGPDRARLETVRVADWVGAADAAWDEVQARAERSVLVGFSMRGAVALHLAARRPPDRLVLLAPHWRFAARRAFVLPVAKHVVKALRPFKRADFREPRMRQAFAEMDPTLDLDDPTIQARRRRETVLPMATLDELRRVSAAAPHLARRVTAPALVIQGRRDDTVRVGYTRRLATRLGGPLVLHEVVAGHLLVADDGPAWPTVRDLVTRFAMAAGMEDG